MEEVDRPLKEKRDEVEGTSNQCGSGGGEVEEQAATPNREPARRRMRGKLIN